MQTKLQDCTVCRVVADRDGNFVLGWVGERVPFQAPDFEQFTKDDPYRICRSAGFPPRPEYRGQYMRKVSSR